MAAGPEPDPIQVSRARSARAAVAHFRGDFAAARDGWLAAGEGRVPESGALIASAALAAAYGGDPASARELLDRAHAVNARTGCGSHAAFASYVEGEVRASASAEEAVPYYLEAIDGARRSGATFFEGVATVALASVRTRIGDIRGGAEGFAHLLDFWRRTGQPTQLWTTARNAAGLLTSAGRSRTAALLLIAADAQPGAAAVDPRIARFSGRIFTAVTDVVTEADIPSLRAEIGLLGLDGVLDRAVADLRELARGDAEGG